MTGEQDLWIKLWNRIRDSLGFQYTTTRQPILFLHDPYVGVLEKK